MKSFLLVPGGKLEAMLNTAHRLYPAKYPLHNIPNELKLLTQEFFKKDSLISKSYLSKRRL